MPRGAAVDTGFRPMIKSLVAVGGDANANCSLAAQIASVVTGPEEFPEEWLKNFRDVFMYDKFEEITSNFSYFVREKRGIQTLF